jgi:hypothetical protein
MDNLPLAFNYDRRFGVEIEVNALDGRDFVAYPLHSGELPKGIEYIASLLQENLGKSVSINKWHYTHNNDVWVLKPDSSCGIEICSPVSKRWAGLKEICKVIELLKNNPTIKADSHCSLHVHVEVADLHSNVLNRVLAYWMKCEPVFLDAVPDNRKLNRYCQCIGETDMFSLKDNMENICQKLGNQKYLTINTYHMCKGKRKTIEFRIIGNEGCKNPYLVKNWVRLLIHFVEMASSQQMPAPFEKGNRWSSFCWLDLEDVFELLKFDGKFELSKGLEQTRNWFLASIRENCLSKHEGIWSPRGRDNTLKQVDKLISNLGLDVSRCLAANDPENLYAETYRA